MVWRKKRIRYNDDTQSLVADFLNSGKQVTVIVNTKYGTNKELDRQIKDFYNSNDWKQKRREIFSIHARVCNYCDSTTLLQVDHKLPLRYNWDKRLNEENLQILCKECNYQKGNHPVDELPKVLVYKRIVYKDSEIVSEKELKHMIEYLKVAHTAALRGEYAYGE